MKIFSYDSKFSQLILKLCYACYLNLLWFLCSLPIFTIGASTTALYYVSLKVIRGEEHHVSAQFFRSFRENFKQSTLLWLILLAAGLFLGGDIYILFYLRSTASGSAAVLWTLILAVVFAASVIYVIVLLYIFPLVASFSNTSRAMLKNAFLIGTHYLFATILVFLVHIVVFYIVVAWFTPFIVFGEGLCAIISAFLLDNILIACSGVPEHESTDTETP